MAHNAAFGASTPPLRLWWPATVSEAGVIDDPLDVNFITGALQQQTPGRVAQDIEIPVVHRAHDPLGLLGLPETEAGMDGADYQVTRRRLG